ncbi:hypothetical protein ACQPYH_44005 [Kribbella sp. CA-245084]|uniref:hypothetical protein n=1 Tax=Kribbella sp. CA-245084 TaxID=3239940 RepID=UPI003D8AC250
MPDTDDDQSVELDPVQRESGDDDTEAARERRAAQARAEADRRPIADLTAEEDAERRAEQEVQVRLEEEDAAHAERIELATKDQHELEEVRDRGQLLDATAETELAMKRAYADEAARDRYRGYATTETQQSIKDLARGRHELDEAAAHPDERGSAELAAKGRRDERASGIEARQAESDDRLADRYDASAREYRREVSPDPRYAVQNPPKETPEAQLPQARRNVRSRLRTKRKTDRSAEPDLEL